MGIRVANARAENAMAIDHRHDFVVRGHDRYALSRQKSYYAAVIATAAKRQLTNHARVAKWRSSSTILRSSASAWRK
ncbi:hypothetical protein FHT85_005366 [Rhizobium sp. BK312]|nr:hypothetical protein [Rhizobium sp. BK312]